LTSLNGQYESIKRSLEVQSKKTSRLEKEVRFYKPGFYILAGVMVLSAGVAALMFSLP
jgi:hypothetical protein